MKPIITLLVALLAWSVTANPFGSVTFTTNDFSRGFSKTSDSPAVNSQLGFQFSDDLAFGIDASNVQGGGSPYAEIEPFVGINRDLVGLDVSFHGKWTYEIGDPEESFGQDFEFTGSIGWDIFSFGTTFNIPEDEDKEFIYPFIDVDLSSVLVENLSFHVGYTLVRGESDRFGAEDSYVDYGFSTSWSFLGFTHSVKIVGTLDRRDTGSVDTELNGAYSISHSF